MFKDKFSAVWVSYSSLNDYVKCPRAYYLRNIYRDPNNRRKISLINPSLTLGQVIHSVIDELSLLPTEQRFNSPLIDRFEKAWLSVSGKRGGFADINEENLFKKRGISMIERIENNPAPLKKKAVKLRQKLPYYWLSDVDNIILCGKIDWLIYDENKDGVEILDFKTGKFDEDSGSMQLPIYALIVAKTQLRPVTKLLYWYLDRDNEPMAVVMPDLSKISDEIMEVAKRIALARKIERFICPKKNGCNSCLPYEHIARGQAIYVGQDEYNQDLYILPSKTA